MLASCASAALRLCVYESLALITVALVGVVKSVAWNPVGLNRRWKDDAYRGREPPEETCQHREALARGGE